MIVMITMISNSPRYATSGSPGFRAKGGLWLRPMSLCESEPGNIFSFYLENTSKEIENVY